MMKNTYDALFLNKDFGEKVKESKEEVIYVKDKFGNPFLRVIMAFIFIMELIFYLLCIKYINSLNFTLISALFIINLCYVNIETNRVLDESYKDDVNDRNDLHSKIMFFAGLFYNLFVLVKLFI